MASQPLPDGLYVCDQCGEARGVTTATDRFGHSWHESTCLCEGLICTRCGLRKRRRPISNYYDLRDGEWWHVPHFAGLARECRDCRRETGKLA